MAHAPNRIRVVVTRWFDPAYENDKIDQDGPRQIAWFRMLPFWVMHLGCLLVLFVGFSWVAVAAAVGMYLARMFFITAFYHRYFSHRAFDTSRVMQACMAVAGLTALQRGPLWWAAHHRHHHRHSDTEQDEHSPAHWGFWWSHVGWFGAERNLATRMEKVRDFARYPELRWLDRFNMVVYAGFALGVFGMGVLLNAVFPSLGTSGWQMLAWVFFVSTVAAYHATYTINSLSHKFGRQRFDTGDDSRNNVWLSLLTLGEGWHNNHHHYPVSARQGFYWWEIDISYYVLVLMSKVGLIWNLKPVTKKAMASKRIDTSRLADSAEPVGQTKRVQPRRTDDGGVSGSSANRSGDIRVATAGREATT